MEHLGFYCKVKALEGKESIFLGFRAEKPKIPSKNQNLKLFRYVFFSF